MSTPPPVFFSHANGFPAGTYRRLFEAWRAAGYEVHAVERYGHDERFPVTSNWPHLRDQLLDVIALQHPGVPLFLVGHSMGGYVSLLAASRRPDLVRGVVLLDSPILGGVLAQAVRLSKATGAFARYSPGRVSMGRRQHWPDADAALAHFAAKPAFARWSPDVLRDYVASGVQPLGDAQGAGHRLSFRREVETAIYNTVPHHIVSLLRRHPIRCPIAFVGGTQSVENRRVGLRATERLVQGRMSWIEGSHLFPFEQPDAAAGQVMRWLQAFGGAVVD